MRLHFWLIKKKRKLVNYKLFHHFPRSHFFYHQLSTISYKYMYRCWYCCTIAYIASIFNNCAYCCVFCFCSSSVVFLEGADRKSCLHSSSIGSSSSSNTSPSGSPSRIPGAERVHADQSTPPLQPALKQATTKKVSFFSDKKMWVYFCNITSNGK